MQGHRDLQTIHVGHEQVRDHERCGSLLELAEPFVTIGRLGDHVPGLFQHLPKESTDLLVVVDDENGTMSHFEVLKDVVAAS